MPTVRRQKFLRSKLWERERAANADIGTPDHRARGGKHDRGRHVRIGPQTHGKLHESQVRVRDHLAVVPPSVRLSDCPQFFRGDKFNIRLITQKISGHGSYYFENLLLVGLGISMDVTHPTMQTASRETGIFSQPQLIQNIERAQAILDNLGIPAHVVSWDINRGLVTHPEMSKFTYAVRQTVFKHLAMGGSA